jgi:hypothetical protein
MSRKRSTSLNTLNADRGLNPLQRVKYLALNLLSNSFGNTHVHPRLRIAPLSPQAETHLGRLDTHASPSRQLSNLWWMSLPWAAIQEEVGPINVLDVGCGSGGYAQQLQAWSGNRLTRYTGVDPTPHKNWANLSQQHPWITFTAASAHTIHEAIPAGTNLIVSQSTLEHIDYDLQFFEQVRDYTVAAKHPVIQLHTFPSAACLSLYVWHGLRQYTPRTVSTLFSLFSDRSAGTLYALGSRSLNTIHRNAITWPWLVGQSDKRSKKDGLYQKRVAQKIRASLGKVSRQPSFYALAIHSHPRTNIFI